VSTLQQRRTLRDLTTILRHDGVRHQPRPASRGLNVVAENAIPMVATFAMVWLATVSLVVINYFIPLNLVSLIYMLPVVVAATQWGIGAGVVAAIAGAAAADFFFYPPLYSLLIRDPQEWIDLVLFVLVALVTSNLAARLKNEVVISSRREAEIRELHTFSQGLATSLTSRDLIFAVQDYLSNALRHRAVLIAKVPDDCGPEDDAVPAEVRRLAARLIETNPPRPSIVVDRDSRKAWLVRVIAPDILGYGAIAVELGDTAGERKEETAQHVDTLLDEAMLMLTHLKVKEAIEQATINYRTEILRDALVGGVSHELRTPLTSILGSCSVLSQIAIIAGNHQARGLVEAIQDQAGQLDNEIRDLLNATRITANGVHPQLTWTDPTDIVSNALKQKERRLASHWVSVDVANDVPLVHVDAILVEQALGQLLENAAKYSPIGSEIRISGGCDGDHVVLSVRDQGGGLTAQEKAQLGKRSFRSDRHITCANGSGLGLWIASTFIAANGGSLCAESPGPNLGSTMSLRLPMIAADTPELVDALND
jgi:K+-sensing histidine kinase KdpD